jgi:hypothetical protein
MANVDTRFPNIIEFPFGDTNPSPERPRAIKSLDEKTTARIIEIANRAVDIRKKEILD